MHHPTVTLRARASSPLFVFNQFGDCVAPMERPGTVHTSVETERGAMELDPILSPIRVPPGVRRYVIKS